MLSIQAVFQKDALGEGSRQQAVGIDIVLVIQNFFLSFALNVKFIFPSGYVFNPITISIGSWI